MTTIQTPVFMTPAAHAEHFDVGLGRLVELIVRLIRALLALLQRRPRRASTHESMLMRRANERAARELRTDALLDAVLLGHAAL